MARQDQAIRYSVEVDGNKDLLSIADGLNAIAKSSSDAAPAATALLEQLKSLAAQNNLVTSLVNDKAQLVDLGNQLFLAKQKAADLQATFVATEAPTAAMSRALSNANASVTSLETQYSALSLTITKGSLALSAAGIDAENLDAAQRGLQASIAGVRAEAAGLATSFDAANAAGQREALTMGEIADRSAVLRAGFEQLKTLLTTFAGILAFEKIKTDIGEVLDTGDKFEKWGQQFSAAFGGAQQGEDALAKVKEIADATPLSLDDVTKAALQAKKEGLDPFDGSLQALIDTTTKFGGGADQLNTLIVALGKSANQGGLNLRTLTALEQQGIPAAQLLGAALGKTADQVTELAKQGKLGADSVTTLIQALGKTSTGGLGDQFALLSTQVTKAKDNYDEFLELISKSGVYDFVRDQLANLNSAFKKGLADGTLQQQAKAISDALIGLGQALISVTKFAVDHGAAITTIVEQYALFKAAMLGVDLVGAAQRFLTLSQATIAQSVATKEATAATASYATAMKSADAAAAAAAAESGGLGKFGAAIGRIPKTLSVALAITGAVDAIADIQKTIDATIQLRELNTQQTQQRQDDATLETKLAAQAATVRAQTLAAAQTQIASATELEQKNQDQSAAYVKSLQDAIRYYTAVAVQDKQLGDSAGAAEAGAKVTAYATALQAATDHAKDLADAFALSADKIVTVTDRFDDLKTKSQSTATAVQGAFSNIEINTPTGLQAMLGIIGSISSRSKDAQQAIQTELVASLQKLDATDLSNVEAQITDLFVSGKLSAQTFETVMKAAVQAQLLSLGATAQQVGTQFDAAGQKIISSFTGVANSAQSTGQQIQFAFAKALSQTTTEGEVNALKEQLQAAFDAGRISAAQFTAGMQAAGRKIADIQTAAIESGAALDGMGTQGVTAAQRISNALQDARDKLVVQADQIAAAIAKALNVDASADVGDLKAQLAGIEAQIADYNTKITAAGDTSNKSFQKISTGAQQAADDTKGAGDAADDASKKYDGFTDTGEEGFADLTKAIADTRQGFLTLSTAAAAFFDQNLKGSFELATESDSAGAGFQRTAEAMAAATAATNDQIANQRAQLQAEITDINNLGTAGSTGFGQFGDSADAAAAKMTSLAQLIASGNYDAGLLGQQELGPLQQALEAAAQRAQQLVDQVKQANDALNQLAQDTQDALDEEEGNQTAIEDRRHQKELDDLQAAAKAANQLNSQVYLQAVQQENQLHALKLKNLAAQQAAQNGGTSPTSSNGSGSSAKSNGGIGSGGSTSADNGNGSGFGGLGNVTIQIVAPQGVIITSQSQLDELANKVILPALRSVQARSTLNIITGKKL
jgi:tape measure domain-containing protein